MAGKRRSEQQGGRPSKAAASAPSGGGSSNSRPTDGSLGRRHAEVLEAFGGVISPNQFLVNASHWADVEAALQKVITHDVFAGITTEVPLGLESSGVNPFSIDDCRRVLNKSLDSYTCGFNAFWASPFYTTTPGVPINRAGALRMHVYQCPDATNGLHQESFSGMAFSLTNANAPYH